MQVDEDREYGATQLVQAEVSPSAQVLQFPAHALQTLLPRDNPRSHLVQTRPGQVRQPSTQD